MHSRHSLMASLALGVGALHSTTVCGADFTADSGTVSVGSRSNCGCFAPKRTLKPLPADSAPPGPKCALTAVRTRLDCIRQGSGHCQPLATPIIYDHPTAAGGFRRGVDQPLTGRNQQVGSPRRPQQLLGGHRRRLAILPTSRWNRHCRDCHGMSTPSLHARLTRARRCSSTCSPGGLWEPAGQETATGNSSRPILAAAAALLPWPHSEAGYLRRCKAHQTRLGVP